MSNKFVEHANLPVGEVDLLLLGAPYKHFLEKTLTSLGITPLWLPENMCVDPHLKGHADLMALYMGNGKIVCVSSLVNILSLTGMYVIPASAKQSIQYPNDCALNGCLLKNHFIHRLNVTDPSIRMHLEGIHCLDVRQAYAKCSICVVHENAIITSDPGISAAAASRNIDVLTICPGYIDLPGYNYGFIGGATFKISRDILAFTGTLNHHPDQARILHFLRKYDVQPFFLTQRNIVDIGSAIPLTEHGS